MELDCVLFLIYPTYVYKVRSYRSLGWGNGTRSYFLKNAPLFYHEVHNFFYTSLFSGFGFASELLKPLFVSKWLYYTVTGIVGGPSPVARRRAK